MGVEQEICGKTNKGRLFKSINKGASWQVFQTPYDSQFEIAFKDENIGVAMGKISDVVKYYRTTNGGENWSEITPTGNFYTADFTYIPNTDTLISAGVASPNIGLSFSTDNGTTFQEYADFYKNYQFLSFPKPKLWAIHKQRSLFTQQQQENKNPIQIELRLLLFYCSIVLMIHHFFSQITECRDSSKPN